MSQRRGRPQHNELDSLPCAGTRVVDLTQGMAGPMATMVLADHGADVIKVEPPGGDWARTGLRGFSMWNRGKRSIALNLDASSERAELGALTSSADVVVTDWNTSGQRLDHAGLVADNPHIVHCHISAWGSNLDDPHHPATDATLSAATGQFVGLDLLSGKILHASRIDPTFSITPTASYAAAMLGAQSILAALFGRDAGQPGEYIETSLLHGSMAFLMRHELARPIPPRQEGTVDLVQRGIELSFLTAECADGRYIQMCARQDHHFRSWLRVLGIEDILDDDRFSGAPMRVASFDDADELEGLLRERMRSRSQAEWMAIFVEEEDIGADPFLTPEEFLAHPQMVANGRVVEVDDPRIGRSKQVGVLAAIDGWTPTSMAAAPALDQHGGQLRAEFADRPDAAPETTADEIVPRTPSGPLAGVTILEVAYFVAGPLATTLLAELGARVIKVEPHAGDPYRRTGLQSAKFLHGKESISLDLKHPDGRAILHDLISRSDVLVHSFRTGVPERLGMDEATARQINPNLVYLNAASYGTEGPEASRVAFHSTPTALSGAGIAQAGIGNPPVDDSFPDPAAGLGAATALMVALHQRARTGTGCSIETTMLTSAGYVVSNDLVLVDGTTHATIADHEQLGTCATHRLYPCSQGWVFLALLTDTDWRCFTAAVGATALSDDDRFASPEQRSVYDRELVAEVGQVFESEPAQYWQDHLTAAGVACASVDFTGFEAWLERHDRLLPARHPQFDNYYRLPPKALFASRPAPELQACAVGEHSRSLLTELGHDSSDIDDLIRSGAVREWLHED